MLRNLSGVSLSDMDSPGVGLTPKAMLYQQRPHTGEAEFVGIALPVDINMIFEVILAGFEWVLFFYLSCFESSVDLDQLVSQKPADQDPHCFPLCL